MSGNLPPGTPPPEVPPEVDQEFAAAYREAYLRALAEQSTGHRHVEVEDHDDVPEGTEAADEWAHRLPQRTGPLRRGTHRDAAEDGTDAPSAFDRARDSRWFVPGMLLLIVLLLVVAAYVGGRLVADTVVNVDVTEVSVGARWPGPGS